MKDPKFLRSYIGRPSPLGNPFKIPLDGNREEVIKKYREWLEKEIEKTYANSRARRALFDLYILAKTTNIELECWCAPQACHGDVIKEFIENGKV